MKWESVMSIHTDVVLAFLPLIVNVKAVFWRKMIKRPDSTQVIEYR
jgi:hypothetical protein